MPPANKPWTKSTLPHNKSDSTYLKGKNKNKSEIIVVQPSRTVIRKRHIAESYLLSQKTIHILCSSPQNIHSESSIARRKGVLCFSDSRKPIKFLRYIHLHCHLYKHSSSLSWNCNSSFYCFIHTQFAYTFTFLGWLGEILVTWELKTSTFFVLYKFYLHGLDLAQVEASVEDSELCG